MSALMWALQNKLALAFIALIIALGVQTKRLGAVQADAKTAVAAEAKASGRLAGCKENAEAFGRAAELALAKAAGREAVASEVAARQTEKALALAKLKAPADCAAGATWAAVQAREIAGDFQK